MKKKTKQLKMMPRRKQMEGFCPVCGEMDVVDEGMSFVDADAEERTPFECHKCGAKGHQIRSLMFDGFTLSEED